MIPRPSNATALGLLVATLLLAVTFAFAGSPLPAPPTPTLVVVSGTTPMPDDARIPPALLPPGADSPDEGPSSVIFPPQHVPLRFNHKFHIERFGASCRTCHEAAFRSDSAQDSLLPKPLVCDGCHGTDHHDLNAVLPGTRTEGQCAFCHQGYQPGDGNRVAPVDIPRPNMVFTHGRHLARNIGCAQCHGDVGQLQLATRDQLPRMAGCFKCHQQDDAVARGSANSTCTTCHLREHGEGPDHTRSESLSLVSAGMRTAFPSGVLTPPQWLHDSQHTPDWIQRHREVAAADSGFCANCHKEDYCTDCHDGRVRPRNIHPADYLNLHPIEARMATQRCTSCHQEQSFCLTCHMRVGVSMDSPEGVKDSGRFHPPKVIWSDAPVQPGHHSFEAERNLNACVSCHTERDCVTCHGGAGIGGGFNPHRAGFTSNCDVQFRRNPRPCLVCHERGDSVLAECMR